MRTVCNPGATPFMPVSRWVTPPWNGWNEQDLRTGGDVTALPLVLRGYSGWPRVQVGAHRDVPSDNRGRRE